MKKIIGLTVAAMMVMGLVGGGTWAYFSDPEVSGQNLFAAGTLDLEVGGGSDTSYQLFASLSNKKPGDSGNGTVALDYAGSLNGTLNVQFSGVDNANGSGGSEYEQTGSGELGAALEIAPYIDVDQSGDFTNSVDFALTSGGSTDQGSLQWDDLDTFGGTSWTNVYGAAAPSGSSDNFSIEWRIDYTNVGNEIQGDSANFTITLTLVQE
jgi:predicted ribosomally synthesized peptide with SipW-like signal peptide